MLKKTITIFFLLLTNCGRVFTNPDNYQVYFATLDGTEIKPVLSHENLGISHVRISPDKQWMTFTRYTNRRLSGFADEADGYAGTEIVLAKIDGSEMRTLVPAKPDKLACNSTWVPEGGALVYISTDTADKLPKLFELNLKSGKQTMIPTPKGLSVADPDIVGNQIVFPVIEEISNSIWLMNRDGSNARKISSGKAPDGAEPEAMRFGDYDPKLSPDGKKVAFMRYFGKNEWHTIVLDIESGAEQDLSGKGDFDAIPEWSSDGNLLIFLHIDFDDLTKLGIYTMHPDGSDRKMLNLPRKMVHGHPRFFPGEGSGPKARFVFTAQSNIFVP